MEVGTTAGSDREGGSDLPVIDDFDELVALVERKPGMSRSTENVSTSAMTPAAELPLPRTACPQPPG
jgi:hypothetical protein